MKKLFAFPLFLLFAFTVFAQTAPFTIAIEEEPFPGFPALQSFVEGRYDGKWVFIGGRTDGLHQRQLALTPQL